MIFIWRRLRDGLRTGHRMGPGPVLDRDRLAPILAHFPGRSVARARPRGPPAGNGMMTGISRLGNASASGRGYASARLIDNSEKAAIAIVRRSKVMAGGLPPAAPPLPGAPLSRARPT